MNAPLSTALPNRLQRVVGVVVVLGMVAAGVSSALASELPGAGGNQRSAAQDWGMIGCEEQSAQAVPDRQSATPPLAGLALLRSETSHYDLWRPAGWTVSGAEQDALVLIAPNGQYQGAHFSIEVTDAPNLTGADLQWRAERFNSLLHVLPNSQVAWQAFWFSGNMAGFEARHTYRNDDIGIEWTRWVRLLYVGTEQYWLVAEAPSTAAFESSQLMFAAMMLTFRPDDRAQQYVADMCMI